VFGIVSGLIWQLNSRLSEVERMDIKSLYVEVCQFFAYNFHYISREDID